MVEGVPEVLYLSDAHVEMMLIHTFGPRTEFAATGILRAVKMVHCFCEAQYCHDVCE